jgi:hypothetical protein
VDTGFVDHELTVLLAPPARGVITAAAAVAAAVTGSTAAPGAGRTPDVTHEADPWTRLAAWGRITS